MFKPDQVCVFVLLGVFVVGASAVDETPPIVVTNFGAVPDDGNDDTAAVVRAIGACRDRVNPVLHFPPGRYDIAPTGHRGESGVCLLFEEIDGLTVTGPGAQCFFREHSQAFYFHRCDDLRVRGVTIDWDRPLFSVGKIVATGDRSFDVAVDEEFPVEGGEPVHAFMDYDPVTKLPRHQGLDVYHGVSSTELIAPQVLRVHLKKPQTVQVGTLAVLRHHVYGGSGLYFMECDDVHVEDVTIYHAPGMAVTAKYGNNLTLERTRVMIKPGTKRLLSTTADGAHIKAYTGMIRMKDCVFEGMGDDAANISNLYLTISERLDDYTVVGAHNLKIHQPPKVGDDVAFLRIDTLKPYAGNRVAAVELVDAGKAAYRVTLAEPLPDDFALGDVMGNMTRAPSVRISGCRVGRNRARGFLLQTRDAIVEDCSFTDCTSGGVWAMSEVVFFYEGVPARDIIVRDNTFTNCNYGGPIGDAVLAIYAYMAEFKFPPEPGVFQNILFENNTIDGADNSGILIVGGENVVIRSNRLINVCQKPTRQEGHAAVYVAGSRNVVLADNAIDSDQQGEGYEADYRVGPGCDEPSIHVERP